MNIKGLLIFINYIVLYFNIFNYCGMMFLLESITTTACIVYYVIIFVAIGVVLKNIFL